MCIRDRIRPLHDVRALWELVGTFRRLRPKIVHTHSSKAGILGRLAAWLAGVPCILHTIHGHGVTPAQPFWQQKALIALEPVSYTHLDVYKRQVLIILRFVCGIGGFR